MQKFWGQKEASVLEKQKKQGLCKGWKDGHYHLLMALLSVSLCVIRGLCSSPFMEMSSFGLYQPEI